jgi:hypothetical protein
VPESVPLGSSVCVPLRSGDSVAWSIVDGGSAR